MSAKGDPAALQLTSERLQGLVGEEAPEACAGPRSPDVFYRGEEAGAVLKTYSQNEMEAKHTPSQVCARLWPTPKFACPALFYRATK